MYHGLYLWVKTPVRYKERPPLRTSLVTHLLLYSSDFRLQTSDFRLQTSTRTHEEHKHEHGTFHHVSPRPPARASLPDLRHLRRSVGSEHCTSLGIPRPLPVMSTDQERDGCRVTESVRRTSIARCHSVTTRRHYLCVRYPSCAAKRARHARS
jgi:hypothetical protein